MPRLFAIAVMAMALPALLACTTGCKAIVPSNVRVWQPDQSRLNYVHLDGNQATVYNIRNAQYVTEDDYLLSHYDKTYDLDKIRTIDFIVVPFQGSNTLAHTMMSFGFEGDEYLCLSIEIRKEEGEDYVAWKGSARQYEIQYILADERDVIRLRTNYRNDDVYVYRTAATPEMAREIFLDVCARTNKLYQKPEFYDTLANNCTNNLVRHINKISPRAIPYGSGVLLPGLSDRYVYELGFLESTGSFESTRQAAWVSGRARANDSATDFSRIIRAR